MAKPSATGSARSSVRHLFTRIELRLSQQPPKKRSETADKYDYENDDPEKTFVYVAFADDQCEPVFRHLSLA
jgi:hypothetical protein